MKTVSLIIRTTPEKKRELKKKAKQKKLSMSSYARKKLGI